MGNDTIVIAKLRHYRMIRMLGPRLKHAFIGIVMVFGFLNILTIFYHVIRSRNFLHLYDRYSIYSFNDTQGVDSVLRLERPDVGLNHRTGSPTHSPLQLLGGKHRNQTGYLTIGFSTVPRQNASYLYETLSSLISKLTPDDRKEVVIVVFMGSTDTEWQQMTLSRLHKQYDKEMSEGVLQLVRPPHHIYPNYSQISKFTFGDSFERVKWRTQQNIDFAYLFEYCANISKYYLHIEDDVLTASGFVKDIKYFADHQMAGKDWFCLEFCRLGFIGKMFHSSELRRMKEYLLLFQSQKPCDVLLRDLMHSMLQDKFLLPNKSLFQHIGKMSSLANKTQNLEDNKFKDRSIKKNDLHIMKHLGNILTKPNPLAYVTTDMSHYQKYLPSCSYFKTQSCFFWGTDADKDRRFEVKFRKTETVRKIRVHTGHPRLATDKLQHGVVKVAHGKGISQTDKCGDLREIGEFKDGLFESDFKRPINVTCVVIEVTQSQTDWLIISGIEVT